MSLHLTTLAPHAAQALHALHDGGVLLGAITAHEAVLLGAYAALRALRTPSPHLTGLLSAALTGLLSAPLWTPGLTAGGVGGLFILCLILTVLAAACVAVLHRPTRKAP